MLTGATCALAVAFGLGTLRGELFYVLFGSAALATTLLGLVAMVVGFRLAYRLRAERYRAVMIGIAPPLALVGVVLFAQPIVFLSDAATYWTRLVLNRSTYERIIVDEQRTPHHREWLTSDGVEYIADRGPPLRIVFHPNLFFDESSGLVFDPTRRVASARGWGKEPSDFTIDADLPFPLGNGASVSCTHMVDDYFRCSSR